MNEINQLTDYLLSFVGSEEDYPFGPDTQVFKVKEKIFALVGFRNGKYFINLKAEPNNVLFLTEQFESVTPGYHMNKKHWISVEIGHDENESMLKGLIGDSYQIIKLSLTKKRQAELERLNG